MPFKKGERHPNQGGPVAGRLGGRPTKEQKEVDRRVEERVREYVAKHVDPVLDTYIALAAGKVVVRMTPEGKKEFILDVNPRTTIDVISKFMPAAKQTIAVEAGGELESAIRRLREKKEHK